MRNFSIAAVTVFAGYVFLLAFVPYWAPPDPALPNVAAKLGYNLDIAYLAVIFWTVAVMLLVFFSRVGDYSHQGGDNSEMRANETGLSGKWLRLEWAAVFILFFVAYFPLFLSRHGDFIEDRYFLSTLYRMVCGDKPYSDFEFLYGPMMIFPVHLWTSTFGFSLASYYGFLALLQGSFFAVLIATLQRYLKDWRARYFVFLLLAAPLFDVLLGMNYVGWRRMLPVFAIMIVAARPFDIRFLGFAAAILGFEIAYSYEYGLAGLAACAPIYGLLLMSPEVRWRVVRLGLSFAALSIAFGLAFTLVATGAGFVDYLTATLRILAEASAKGLGGFKFYWTLHSLSLIALLSVAVVIVALGLRGLKNVKPAEGDLLLIGGFAFALISLKIAFQRADVWHMASPFLALSMAFLLRPTFRLFPLARTMRPAAVVLIAIASFATVIGYLPMGMFYGSGLASGAKDVLSATPRAGAISSRGYSVQSERTVHQGHITELASYLASPSRKDRPVMFYKGAWELNHHIGVCPIGYSFYDLLYSEAAHPLAETLSANEDALVVMLDEMHDQLLSNEPFEPRQRILRKREWLGVYLSTVHYFQSPIETGIEYEMWKDALGDYVLANFEIEGRVGPFVILARNGMASRTASESE